MNNKFAENLKKVRKENHLSQEQLADELGVSRQAISKWESSLAYPEMDKIIALCDKFDLKIDDLLHKDIREVKGEEERKKTLNKTIDGFLNFITDTINLFSNMSFKSKIKCLVEQGIIIAILFIVSNIIIYLGNSLISNFWGFLPTSFRYLISNFLETILIIFCIISAIIILAHVFKTRYLDYYNKLKKDLKNNEEIEKIENNTKPNKTLFKEKENQIIIRDPKHSEYNFINSLFKFIVGIIKFLALWLALFICFILVFLFIGFIVSFLVYKTGLFFIGFLLAIASLITITTIFLLIILNFIFNRKSAKKKMIWTFIIALATLGCAIGLIIIGSLKFEVLENNASILKTEEIEFDMQDYTFIDTFGKDINYIEADNENIKLEAKLNKYCDLKYQIQSNPHGILIWSDCTKPMKIIKQFINNLNNKKIISLNNDIQDITIYASKENIAKITNNEENYFNKY